MELLGIGPLELAFIVIIAIIVFGPKDLANGARTLGRWLNRLYRSENYHLIQRASSELRNLPSRLAREANLEELQTLDKELRDTAKTIGSATAGNPLKAWVAPQQKPASAPPAQKPGASEPKPPPSSVEADSPPSPPPEQPPPEAENPPPPGQPAPDEPAL